MCEVCKSASKKLYTNTVYQKGMEPITLKLCFEHDLELFKRGQDFFLLKYRYELTFALKDAISLETPADDISDLKFT